MTEAEKRTLLTKLTEETDADVLDYALLIAKDEILKKAFPFLSTLPDTLPAKYESTQLQIAEYLVLKQGASGEKERTENGIKQVFESGGIPESLMRNVVPKMKSLGNAAPETEQEDTEDGQEQTEQPAESGDGNEGP